MSTPTPLRIVVLGLSLSSSWGNGHATTYRALLQAMAARGHEITFLEREQRWYAGNRDLEDPDFCRLVIYRDLFELGTFAPVIAAADAVIVGSFVPQGIEIGSFVQATALGVTAFYDIDTPVTLTSLERSGCDYITPDLVSRYDIYLSFTGGPTLDRLADQYGVTCPYALFCSVDPEKYAPLHRKKLWDLSYLGTYSDDRQPLLERLLLEPARRCPALRFVVAGPQYPDHIDWPSNVERIDHVGPSAHAEFYTSSRFTLNVTRADMIAAGYSPSVRLFEAAACETPILSDRWAGIETLFRPGRDILLPETADETIHALTRLPEETRLALGRSARQRILARHTGQHRAGELEAYLLRAIYEKQLQAGAEARSGRRLRA